MKSAALLRTKECPCRMFPAMMSSVIVGGALFIMLAAVSALLRHYNSHDVEAILYTPWASVGGCGAGGSGGGSADGIKWLGRGVQGGVIDVEVLPKYNFGQNFKTLTIAPRVSFRLSNVIPIANYSTKVAVNVPIVSKSGEVQFRSNQTANDRTTGGLGDISADIGRTVGINVPIDLTLGMSFPTGQYDVKRGPDAASEFLPSSLQKGSGLFNASFIASHSHDVEDGMWMVEGGYSHPFAMRLFSGKNEFIDEGEYYHAFADSTDNRRFYYRFKHYGENDRGAFTPPSLSAAFYYMYKGLEEYAHSWGIAVGIPLGVAWIGSEKTTQYDPRPDPDHKAWSAALVYQLEFSRPKYPVLLAISLPIHDKKNDPNPDNEYDPSPMKKWDGPDWKDFLQQWTFAVGFKSTMF